MGNSYVKIYKDGFWMEDSIIELWLLFVSLHVEDSPEETSEAHNIRDQWLLASRGYFHGCVPDGINEAVATEEGRKIVIDSIKSLLSELYDAPKVLDKGVLNIMGRTGKFRDNFPTHILVDFSLKVLSLLVLGPIDEEESCQK